MKKIVGIILAISILVVFASGCTSSNNMSNNSSNGTSNQNNSNVTLQITADGPWTGDYAYTNGDMQINGTGNANYNLGLNPGHVTVSIENKGNGTLTVQLLRGGNVVQTQSTSESMGIVNIDQKF
ncbi:MULTISPECIES: hypothetical protein [Methanobacterium]|uniref:Uncharacterized protein n=1 Tax=Methanobacterium bryantii TaxID=2161 RepID=A0A2A2H9S1_METBR|nr:MULTISPECIES: hypothetical protein [Methanobacterium]OEC86958.1 hypothetical protein A9507_08590 [Methanobacterium sp. A39]PAV06020.1 hypothetical protein ASJ80_14335 [Methanobacterium bryantii]